MSTSKQLWSTKTTADFLDSSVFTLEKLRSTGGGPPFVKMNRKVLYRPSDVEAWVAERICTSTADARERKRAEAA